MTQKLKELDTNIVDLSRMEVLAGHPKFLKREGLKLDVPYR
jgi:hypothetical protein